MKLFLRYGLLLLAILAWTRYSLPPRYGLQFPRSPGPVFSSQVRSVYIKELNKNRPEIFLLGDSTLLAGVDPQELSRLTGESTFSATIPGSASALWYLILKNNIVDASFHPRYLIVISRDSILTAPGYRVQGSYFTLLDEYAAHNEPILLKRSFLNLMNPLDRLADQFVPLYGARVQSRQEVDSLVRYSVPGWMGCDSTCTDTAMRDTFGAADLEPGQLRDAVAAAERYLYTPRQLDFSAQVDQSYLPEMIRLTKAHGIQLIVVRIKTRASGMGDIESQALKNYISGLSAYLKENNVPYLDFGTDPRLKNEYFRDSIHLNVEGKKVFTQILGEALRQILK